MSMAPTPTRYALVLASALGSAAAFAEGGDDDGLRSGISIGPWADSTISAISVETQAVSQAGVAVFTGSRANVQGGTIVTHGDASRGLDVNNGSRVIASDLTISTSGELSHGVSSIVSSSIDLHDTGVTTQGVGAIGLMAHNSSSLTATRTQVTTHGESAVGVRAQGGSSAIHLYAGQVVTRGALAHGLSAKGVSRLDGKPVLITAHDSLVRTHGTQAHGVLVEDGARVDLHNTVIEALGQGASAVSMAGGTLTVNGGALQSQSAPALTIAGEDNLVVIDNAYVGSEADAVFRLEDQASADIEVRNGSVLSAADGNGNILELGEGSQLNLVIDNSLVNGHLLVEEGQDVNIELSNGTRLNGQVSGVGSLEVGSGGHWEVAGDSRLDHLKMEGGLVSFGDDGQFQRLTIGQLSGEGLFALRLDIEQGEVDFLEIEGEARGSHLLRIQNNGIEPDAGFDPLEVVRTGGGDGLFALIGGRVDLGAFSYELEQQGDSWYVSSNGRTVSPSAATAQALFNTAPTIWYGEMTTLRGRMGDLRSGGLGGAWMRSYGNRFDVASGSGLGYRQRQTGLSLGADKAVSTGHGQLALGVLAGYSHSTLNLSRGSRGGVDSYYVGAYGSWLDDSGYYADVAVKLNQFQNHADVAMSDGTKAQGENNSYGIGSTLEVGRRIALEQARYLEPFAQLSGLAVRSRNLSLDNGLLAQGNGSRSLLAKVGGTFGQHHALQSGGFVQPYLKAAVAQEFARKNDVKVNGHRFRNDLHGTRGELGAGMAVSMSANLQLHGHVDYMKGQQIEQPFGVNVGVRYAFD